MPAPAASDTRSPFQGEQGDQRMIAWRAEPGGGEERADLVAVQRDSMGFAVDPGTADVGSWPAGIPG
jgi:hypothetical protein